MVIFYPPHISKKYYRSTVRELCGKNFLKDHVNFIQKNGERHVTEKNNIFIVEGSAELAKWGYDYSRVIYVIDYGRETQFQFDYKYKTYAHCTRDCSTTEKAKRMDTVGVDKIGRYVCLSSKITDPPSWTADTTELSSYVVKMVDYGLEAHIPQTLPRVKQCLSLLESWGVVKREEGKIVSGNERVFELVREAHISPLDASFILKVQSDDSLSQGEKTRLLNLCMMATVVVHCEGSLRMAKQQEGSAHIKPNGIWRKSGYLESCLEILTKCELIEARERRSSQKSQSFRRQTSKFNEFEFEVFGSMFEQIQPKRKTFEDMDLHEFIRDCGID